MTKSGRTSRSTSAVLVMLPSSAVYWVMLSGTCSSRGASMVLTTKPLSDEEGGHVLGERGLAGAGGADNDHAPLLARDPSW